MRHLVIACTVPLVMAACSPIRTATPQPSPASLPATPPSAANTAILTVDTQPAPANTATPAMASAGPVALQVLSPEDSAVVGTQQITVAGSSSPGAVVTVNDDILIAGADGQWQDTVTLEEGLNLIEIIASNTSGSEASVELTVTYEP